MLKLISEIILLHLLVNSLKTISCCFLLEAPWQHTVLRCLLSFLPLLFILADLSSSKLKMLGPSIVLSFPLSSPSLLLGKQSVPRAWLTIYIPTTYKFLSLVAQTSWPMRLMAYIISDISLLLQMQWSGTRLHLLSLFSPRRKKWPLSSISYLSE